MLIPGVADEMRIAGPQASNSLPQDIQTRIRDAREWNRMSASLLHREQRTRFIIVNATMLELERRLSPKATAMSVWRSCFEGLLFGLRVRFLICPAADQRSAL
jgi:hypothetical protein